MHIQEEIRDDVVILTPGETHIGDQIDQALKESLNKLIHQNNIARIVVDLGSVKWMTSSAFGLLAAAQSTLKQRGGGIHIARPQERVVSAFTVMQLEKLFNRYNTVEEAVTGFSNP